MITRFSVLPDERRLMLGIDKSNLFEAGYVYEAIDILDTIVIRKVGKYALQPTGQPSENSDNNEVIYYGYHLLTQPEFNKMCESTAEKLNKDNDIPATTK